MFSLNFVGHKASSDSSITNISTSFSINVDHVKMVTENDDDSCTITTSYGDFISRKRPQFKEETGGTEVTFVQFLRLSNGGRYMTIIHLNQFILKYEQGDVMIYQTLLGDCAAKSGYQSNQEIFNIESGSIFKY